MASTKCRYCGSDLGPRPSGCLPMIICFAIGVGVVWFALYVMNGLTHGGIWK